VQKSTIYSFQNISTEVDAIFMRCLPHLPW